LFTPAFGSPNWTASAPLRSFAREGGFEPVIIELSAGGPWEGELRIWAGEGSPELRRAIQLPDGERRRVVVAAPTTGQEDLHVELLDSRGGRVPVGGGVPPSATWRAPAPTPSPGPCDLRVLVLGDDPLGLSLLREVGCGSFRDCEGGRAVRVELASPRDLPPEWQSLLAVDLLLWTRPDPGALTAEQQIALRSWVAQGGVLVLAWGEAAPLWPGSGLESLWPGLDPRLRDDPSVLPLLGGLWPRAGSPDPESGFEPLPVLDLGPSQMPTGEGRGLLAEAAWGDGVVVGLGWDPTLAPVRDAVDRAGSWREIFLLGVPAPLEAQAVPPELGDLSTDARKIGGIVPSPRWASPRLKLAAARLGGQSGGEPLGVTPWLMGFEAADPLPLPAVGVIGLAFVLAIGPLDRFLVRRSRRPLLAWLSLPLWSLAFSVGIVAYVALGKAGGSEARCEVRSILDGALTRSELRCALWSSHQGVVRATIEGGLGTFFPGPTDATLRPGLEPTIDLHAAHWSVHELWARDIRPSLGGLTPVPRGYRNDTGLHFTEAAWTWGALRSPAGALAPGAALAFPAEWTPSETWTRPPAGTRPFLEGQVTTPPLTLRWEGRDVAPAYNSLVRVAAPRP
jgi:hypothetical protein